MHAQLSALADAVPRMPQACEEMGEVSFIYRSVEGGKGTEGREGGGGQGEGEGGCACLSMDF